MDEQDLRIAAWLDGTMSADEAARFEAELDSNPALAEQVAAWQGNDDLLRAAYQAPIDQGVDDALLTRMGLAPQPAPLAASNDNPVRRWAFPLGGALAAGIALAIMLTGKPTTTVPGGGQGPQIADAMERLPSRGTLAMADGGTLSPLLSFAAADGRYCREFSVTGGQQPGGGIACKGAAGWSIEAHSAAGSAAGGAEPGKIAMAGGADSSGLDAAYARLGASDPLSIDSERQLIASGWKKSPEGKR